MNRRKEKENFPPTRVLSNRVRKPSDRAKKTRAAKAAKEKTLKDKKLQKAWRKALKQRDNENALTVERAADTAEVRELRAALARAQGERNAAEAAVYKPHGRRQGPVSRSIPRPRNLATVTIRRIRDHLDLAGREHDQAWADLRTDVRRFMDAGLLNLNVGWKEQDNRRLGKVYDAIDAAHPELERFRGQ
ncbi:hypothetical protein DFH09DRAFT_1436108 [Mycena vulgaris]|nr:hypothetical protein DFH09DRAFT_1436108 [Mycena vulgaris]